MHDDVNVCERQRGPDESKMLAREHNAGGARRLPSFSFFLSIEHQLEASEGETSRNRNKREDMREQEQNRRARGAGTWPVFWRRHAQNRLARGAGTSRTHAPSSLALLHEEPAPAAPMPRVQLRYYIFNTNTVATRPK